MMRRILRFALVALMAIASAVFIYGMIQEFSRLPPPSTTTNQGNPQPH
jgi:TRAP-type C4-dicarboxylate transport system permease small subunit